MGVVKKWKFFNEIDAFLTVRHNVNPLKIIDTMAEGDEQGVHEFDDGEQGRLEDSSFDQVNDMINMYGKGESHLQKCPTCDYEEELKSGGVHVTENGAVIVYANDDQFSCPNCSSENDKQQPENISGFNDNGGNDNCPVMNFQKEVNPVTNMRRSQEKPSTEETKSNRETAPSLPRKKRKSNVEKSLEVIFAKFGQSSAAEFERYQKFEQDRIDRK
ncbi:uncharacterized protein LOC124455277 [Xenia sp. Carnegie-2017]|uniref:uncharacterized protein LOC124455277 n=1 Tax=Xenia sp. Carnegie-2017 TaxID=2897299 RepID=UPI001F04FE40|nr:uncharacterized protein LOC124455277 [Xenia sp. Carnegie-2017]